MENNKEIINNNLLESVICNQKCFLFLILLYLTIKLITILTIYKIIEIGSLTFSVSAIILPLWFFLGDVITEVYGYKIMRYLIWVVLVCQFVFALICWASVQLPSPDNFIYQDTYQHILGSLPRVVVASFVAIFLGVNINSYLLSKWKVMTNGRFFIARSFISTMIGEFIFTCIAYCLEFFGVVPLKQIVELIMASYCIKLAVNICSGFPLYVITNYVKKIEGREAFETDITINPFVLSR